MKPGMVIQVLKQAAAWDAHLARGAVHISPAVGAVAPEDGTANREAMAVRDRAAATLERRAQAVEKQAAVREAAQVAEMNLARQRWRVQEQEQNALLLTARLQAKEGLLAVQVLCSCVSTFAFLAFTHSRICIHDIRILWDVAGLWTLFAGSSNYSLPACDK